MYKFKTGDLVWFSHRNSTKLECGMIIYSLLPDDNEDGVSWYITSVETSDWHICNESTIKKLTEAEQMLLILEYGHLPDVMD